MYLFIVTILLLIAITYGIMVTRKSFKYQDMLDDHLASTKEAKQELESIIGFFERLSKYNLALDTPEVRELTRNIKKARKIVEKVRKTLGETMNIEEKTD